MRLKLILGPADAAEVGLEVQGYRGIHQDMLDPARK
jgi:hypothetical protein